MLRSTRHFVSVAAIATALVGVALAGWVRGEARDEFVDISIVDFAFEPSTTTLAWDDVAVFTNTGATAHTVTARDGSFDSGTLQPGEGFDLQFDGPGTHAYYCTIHPDQMTGTLTILPRPIESETPEATATSVATEPPTAEVVTTTPTVDRTQTAVATLTVEAAATLTAIIPGEKPSSGTPLPPAPQPTADPPTPGNSITAEAATLAATMEAAATAAISATQAAATEGIGPEDDSADGDDGGGGDEGGLPIAAVAIGGLAVVGIGAAAVALSRRRA